MSYYNPTVTGFAEQQVAQKSHLIELKANYGLSDLRDVVTTTGSGAVTNNKIEYKLNLTANGTDSAILETAVETDISSSVISGGEVLWSGLVDASGANSNKQSGSDEASGLSFDFIRLQPVTLCARTLSTTGASVSSIFRVREEW